MVQSVRDRGLMRVRMLKATANTAGVRFLRDYHNEFHGGSGVTHLDLMSVAAKVSAKFQMYCKTIGLTAKSAGYEKEMKTYVERQTTVFKGKFKPYDSAKTLMSQVTTFNLKDRLWTWTNNCADFLHADYDP
eukprot:10861630-Karenia_brevis.AAC.1